MASDTNNVAPAYVDDAQRRGPRCFHDFLPGFKPRPRELRRLDRGDEAEIIRSSFRASR